MMENRLYRSRSDEMIGGVCGGLARYLGIDTSLVRLFFVLFTFAGGAGPLVYLVLWVVIPREGTTSGGGMNETELRSRAGNMRDEFIEFTHRPNPDVIKWVGAGLIGLGILFLIQQLHVPFLWWLNEDILWPILLVLAGAVLLWRALKGRSQ